MDDRKYNGNSGISWAVDNICATGMRGIEKLYLANTVFCPIQGSYFLAIRKLSEVACRERFGNEDPREGSAMPLKTRVIEGPNGSIAVADVEPEQVMDKTTARTLRRGLSNALGGIPALLRCRLGETFVLDGEDHLYRYGVDPLLDVLPVLTVDV